MADGITLVNTRDLQAQLQRFRRRALGDLEKETRSQFRSLVTLAIQITPPGMGPEASGQAKKRGEKAVEDDIRKLFKEQRAGTSRKKPKEIDIAGLHKRNRDARGRVRRKEHGWKYYVPEKDLRRYIKYKVGHVGFAMGGWVKAAIAAGFQAPLWARRHTSAPGVGSFRVSLGKIEAVAINQVHWLTRSQPELQRKLDYAAKVQANRLSREIPVLIRKAARKHKLAA